MEQGNQIMLRDLLTQKCVQQKKLVTDFGYPRAFRFRKHQTSNFFRLFSRFLSRGTH
jgi:hypothetical protein